MSSALKVVALVGSPTSSATSRTLLLVRHLLESLQQRVHASVELVELAPIARSLGQSLSRAEAQPEVEQALQAIEAAELLVVAAAGLSRLVSRVVQAPGGLHRTGGIGGYAGTAGGDRWQ